MSSHQSLAQPAVSTGGHPVGSTARDMDFERRWAVWVARGARHDRAADRNFALLLAGIAIVAVLLYGFLPR